MCPESSLDTHNAFPYQGDPLDVFIPNDTGRLIIDSDGLSERLDAVATPDDDDPMMDSPPTNLLLKTPPSIPITQIETRFLPDRFRLLYTACGRSFFE